MEEESILKDENHKKLEAKNPVNKDKKLKETENWSKKMIENSISFIATFKNRYLVSKHSLTIFKNWFSILQNKVILSIKIFVSDWNNIFF